MKNISIVFCLLNLLTSVAVPPPKKKMQPESATSLTLWLVCRHVGALDFFPATTHISLHLTQNGQQASTRENLHSCSPKSSRKWFDQNVSVKGYPVNIPKKNMFFSYIHGFCQYQTLISPGARGASFSQWWCVGHLFIVAYSSCICHMPTKPVCILFGFMCLCFDGLILKSGKQKGAKGIEMVSLSGVQPSTITKFTYTWWCQDIYKMENRSL